MKFTPKNHTSEYLLQKIGFVSVNRGWALNRLRRKVGKPYRLHALTYPDNLIDLHEDYIENGKHITGRNPDRMSRWKEIFQAIDDGLEPSISKNMRRNYGIKLTSHYQ